MLLVNAFSLNMLPAGFSGSIQVEPIGVDAAREYARTAVSAVGHADTAAVFAALLGVPVACNRVTVTLEHGDRLLVGQYRGPRLPEGASTLPDGAAVEWALLRIGGTP